MVGKTLRWVRQNAAAVSALAPIFTVLGGVIVYLVGLIWPGLAPTDFGRGYLEGQRVAGCEHRAASAETALETQHAYYDILNKWCAMTLEEQNAEIIKRLKDGTF
jgi:uncharacterized membrane protein YiaA